MTISLNSFLEKLQNSFQAPTKKGFRAKAWERFQEIEWSKEKGDLFRRFPLRKMYENSFQVPLSPPNTIDYTPEILPECGPENFILFVDGVFQKAASKAPLRLLNLTEAEEKFALFLNHRLLLLVQKERDPFSLLNISLAQEGLFFYLPPNTCLEKPVQIHHHITSSEKLLSPRVHLLIGKNAQAQCCFTQSSTAASWVNGGLDILMDEKSSLKVVQVGEAKSALFHTTTNYLHLKKSSRLEMVQVGGGERVSRHNYQATLAGNSHFALSGLNFLKENNQVHLHTQVEHQAPEAYSLQKFKGILEGHSVANFDGKIYIHKEAQQTQAYQLNNTLLLSEQARVYSQPRLEIFADDVKASHGATVGKLNADELFYLLTRGIPQQEAQRILMEGFAKEIFDLIPLSSLRKKCITSFK